MFLLLLLAAAVRLFYASRLPIDCDDAPRLAEAAQVSLAAGRFYLPLTSPDAHHPPLSTWLAALAGRLGGGNVFAIRAFFVLLHVAGLLGLYVLGRALFSHRVAVIALALAAIDRFHLMWSAQILEPGFFFLVPWILYAAYRCVHSPFRGSWIALGALSAGALLYYELSAFLAFPVAFLLVSSPAGRRALRTVGPYAAGGIALSAVVLQQIWLAEYRMGPLKYAASVVGSGPLLTLSPRVLLLYVGDLLICLRDTADIVLGLGTEFYTPFRVPCFWLAGLVYLICTAFCLRFWRENGIGFLLVAFLSVALPLSFLFPRDRWNNFHFAAQTLIPAFLLTAWVIDDALGRRAPRAFAALFFVVMTAWLLVFLGGPVWGCFAPNWEKRYLGKIIYYTNRHGWGGDPITAEDREAIRRLNESMERRHPDSLVVKYYRVCFAANDQEALGALDRARRIAPHSPLVALLEADFLEPAGCLAEARDRLRAALPRDRGTGRTHSRLADVELKLGDYSKAAEYAQEAVRRYPGAVINHIILYYAHTALGDHAAARRDFENCRYWGHLPVARANLEFAKESFSRGYFDLAHSFAQEAVRLRPEDAETQYVLGLVCAERGDLDRAAVLFEGILKTDPGHTGARRQLDRIRETKRERR